jgi:hypothetical protein
VAVARLVVRRVVVGWQTLFVGSWTLRHLSPTLPVGNGIGWLGGRPCPVGFMSGLTRTAGMVVTQAWKTGSLVLSLPIHDVS